MKNLRANFTYANVISTVALFLVLAGGTAFAADQLAKNSIGAKQLKPGAVTAAKIKAGAVTPSALSAPAKSSLTGPQGPQGPQGAAGPKGDSGPKGDPGSAKAWAEVDFNGTVLRSSDGIVAKKLTTIKGYYCISAGKLTPDNSIPLASLNYSDAETSPGDTVVVVATATFNECAKGEFGVRAFDYNNAPSPAGFTFALL
jgi:hypothetical protein